MGNATRRFRATLLPLLLASLFTVAGARAEAQGSPLWDHYKVYFAPGPMANFPLVLIDQFGTQNHTAFRFEYLANPVEKILIPPPGHSPIIDPILHYTWWRLEDTPSVDKVVVAVNQFGDQTITVRSPTYLLAPALKNQSGPLPNKNHYKCYRCEGAPVNRQVRMIDQFETWDATVTFPRYFCNPVEKRRLPTPGPVYPIVDPRQHYVCYQFTPSSPSFYTATSYDQFFQGLSLEPRSPEYLCVPTDKTEPTSSVKGTWGRLKQIYR